MDQKRVVIGRAILALGLLLLLLPLARWGVAFYWQQQVLRQIDSQPWKSTPLEEFINARIAARWQESPAQEPDQIEIPKIGLKAAILPGVTPADLKLGPGLYPQSAAPLEGNVSIAAHRGVYGAWFRHLDKLEPGDEILVRLDGRQYKYSVREQFITHDRDWSIIESSGKPELTLTTCLFTDSSKRLVVKADLVEP